MGIAQRPGGIGAAAGDQVWFFTGCGEPGADFLNGGLHVGAARPVFDGDAQQVVHQHVAAVEVVDIISLDAVFQ